METAENKTLSIINCPLCENFCTKKLTKFENHLINEHQTTSQKLWNQLNNGPKFCACGCKNETKWLGWKVGYSALLKGHNANIYRLYDFNKASEISKKRIDKLTGKAGWAKGLTKESDVRIKRRADATSKGRIKSFEDNKIKIWSKGSTKDNDWRISEFSKRQKEKFASGELTPWAKGKTKQTDDRIRSMSFKVSLTLKQKAIRERLDSLKRLSPEEIKNRIKQTGRLEVIEIIGDYVNDSSQNIIVGCKVCGHQRQDNLRHLQFGRCFNCDPLGSAGQQHIALFVSSLGFDIQTNYKDLIPPQEIDVYVNEKKFAIEYNGLYWHSELRKSNMFHENKTLDCKSKGVQLLHIFEDEWIDKQEIIKSLIMHRLGKDERKIGARECSIIQLTKEQRYDFFEANHIDGDVVIAKTAWGLIYNNEIVAGISVRKPFHKSNSKLLEIARFCTAKNMSVVGGLARLTKIALNHAAAESYDGLITYVDTRLGTGKGYEACGFKYVRSTPPRYWWYHEKSKSRFNRFKYRANKKEGLSEKDIAAEAGVVKIWGCSNLVYELRL